MKKQKICLIGNNGGEKDTFGGQTLKVRLYEKIFGDEKIPYIFIDLHGWIKRIFVVISQIKKAIKSCDTILVMAGANGCRKILPIINYLNKKAQKRVVVSMIGRGVLAISLDKKKINSNEFFLNHNYGKFKDNLMKKHLQKCDAVILETDILTNTYSDFFHLNNCVTLANFRYTYQNNLFSFVETDKTRIVYLSRVRKDKGIFDAIKAVKNIPSTVQASLTIYGEIEMTESDKKMFLSELNDYVVYKGEITNSKVINTIAQYDYFIFPTHCSEGMPGVLIESLLAGTPVISSRFTQVHDILSEGEDSILFDVGNVESISKIITELCLNKEKRKIMSAFAIKNSAKYSYVENRLKLFNVLKIDL